MASPTSEKVDLRKLAGHQQSVIVESRLATVDHLHRLGVFGLGLGKWLPLQAAFHGTFPGIDGSGVAGQSSSEADV